MVKKNIMFNPKILSKYFMHLLLSIVLLVLLYIAYKYLFKNMIETFTNPTIKGYYIMSWVNSPAPPGKWDFGVYFGGADLPKCRAPTGFCMGWPCLGCCWRLLRAIC